MVGANRNLLSILSLSESLATLTKLIRNIELSMMHVIQNMIEAIMNEKQVIFTGSSLSRASRRSWGVRMQEKETVSKRPQIILIVLREEDRFYSVFSSPCINAMHSQLLGLDSSSDLTCSRVTIISLSKSPSILGCYSTLVLILLDIYIIMPEQFNLNSFYFL